MDPHLAHEWLLTRRHFLSRTSTGLGVAALATLLGDDLTAQISGAAPTLPSATGGIARAAALRAQSQTGDLSVPVWSTLSARAVRLQAEARGTARERVAGLGARHAAPDGDDGGAAELSRHPVAVPVRAARRVARVGQRADALHRESGRRSVLRQVDVHRGESTTTPVSRSFRRAHSWRAGPVLARGCLTGSGV
jgi:hypothetical protein